MNALPAAAFSECFTAWVESLRESEPDIVAVDRKGNEITAIPLLLERLERTGALVAIDAVGCQRRGDPGQGADCLPALKDNRPTLAEEVRLFDTRQTVDRNHGRIETRRHRVTRDVARLATGRRFPNLAAIATVAAGLSMTS